MEKLSELVSFEEFKKIDLRIATIKEAVEVPHSEKLVRLTIDAGELGSRTLMAGIKKSYAPSELVGKQVVVVANLAPRKIAGIESQGMLLAVGNEEDVALLAPERKRPEGSRVQ